MLGFKHWLQLKFHEMEFNVLSFNIRYCIFFLVFQIFIKITCFNLYIFDY